MMRLSAKEALVSRDDLAYPSYERTIPPGIVHFGLGAFHRAHQAVFTDICNRDGGNLWMITGVSMRSDTVARQLNPQDGLYTLTVRSSEGSHTQIIGAVAEVLVAGQDRAAIVERISSPACQLVIFTVTEKGYCRASDGTLDTDLAAQGFYPILCEALARRREAGLPGLSLLSCDNLSGNGKQLGRLMRAWIDAAEPDLRDWFDMQCTTPDSMVDRIVPAPSPGDRAELEQRIGLRDEAAIFTEGFSQWVIEDDFAGPRPKWEDHGVQIVDDVAPYETAKLRMLNGSHSLLAYAGLDRGHSFVHQAIADPNLRALIQRLMRHEAAPTIAAGVGQDLEAYSAQLISRFENPALDHRLDQIAMDGSQKIGQRWLEVLADRSPSGKRCDAILTGLAHWLHHVSGDVRPVDDPHAAPLQQACAEGSKAEAIARIFGQGGLVPSGWQPSDDEIDFIVGHWNALE